MNDWERQIMVVFGEALERGSTEERAAYLDHACRENDALRARVDALLAAHQKAGDFLHESPSPEAAPTIDEPAENHSATSIGPYRLVQPIGEGGMGTVYMAEQTHPVQRKVALKLIKPGMDSRQVIARFEAERQALALMDHPNIAKVLDAGTTEAGRPYFVMELVKGVPITKYCDQHHLTPRERLELFVPVCQAVQHAHQKGIIHRDLKPSNVLVCRYDDKPVPKVIDFGVAKATGSKLTEQTLHTEFGAIVGTFEYMSPEQAELNQLDIDTRSDIYSLGVLLYELLTGTTPLERKRLKEVAILELLRLVREEDPPRPSTRLSTVQELPSIAANRGLEPRKLSGLVRGELDWIVMKCLEKDRNRRYETANGLARDIEHYLHDEPVNACPPSRGYRLRKFARKYRKILLAVAAFAMLLLTGAGVSTWQAVRATRAQHVADLERQRAQGNLQVALSALDGIYLQVAEERLPRDPQRKKEDTELLKKALDFYQQFVQQNNSDTPARLEVSRAYRRVGDIQKFVGEHAAAQEAYLAAINRAGELSTEPESSYELSVCHNAMAELLSETGQLPSAAEHFHQAIDLLNKLTADYPAVTQYQVEIARSHHGLGKLLKQKGERRAAEESLRHALDIESKLSAAYPTMAQYRAELAEIHRSLGYWMELGFLYPTTDEVDHLHRACELLTTLVADFPRVPLYRQRLASTFQQLGVLAGSFAPRIEYYNQAITHLTKLVSDFPQVPDYRQELSTCYGNFGVLHWMRDDWDSAAKYYCKARDLKTKLAADYPTVTRYRAGAAVSQFNWADVLIYRGELNQARQALEAALSIERDLLKEYPDNPRHASAVVPASYDLSLVLAASGQQPEALKLREDADRLFGESWKKVRKDRGPSMAALFCADVARELESHAKVWQKKDTGQGIENTAHEMAIKALAQAIALDPEQGQPRYILALAYREQALWLCKLKRPKEALERHRQALAILEKLAIDFPKEPDYREMTVHSQRYIGWLLRDTGQPAEATFAFRSAVGTLEKLLAAAPTPYQRQLLVDTYRELGLLLRDSQELMEAEQAFHAGIALAETLVTEFPSEPGNRQALGDCQSDLGSVLIALKRPQEAEKANRDALEIYQKLGADFPTNGQYRAGLGHGLWQRSDSLSAANRVAEAEKTLREALAIFERLAIDFPKEAFYQQEAAFTCWAKLGPFLAKQSGRLADAEQVYRQGLAAHEKLVVSFPLRFLEFRHRLAGNYDALAGTLRANGRMHDAEQIYRQAIAFYAKLAPVKENESAFRDALADTYGKTALLVYAGGRFDEAERMYRKVLELAPTSAGGCNNLAWFLATCPEAKFRHPQQAIDLAKKAVELMPKDGNNWNTLGVAQYRAGDWKAAITGLEKSMELRKGGDSFDWFFMAMAHWQLGDKKEARKCYDQAVQWMENNRPKNEELARFRVEAEKLMEVKE
jgi:serine/threonine protein kinase/Tfp pilus assembly protein PilF